LRAFLGPAPAPGRVEASPPGPTGTEAADVSLSDMFSGVAPGDAPAFVASKFLGAAVAAALLGWLLKGCAVAARGVATGALSGKID